MTVEVSHQMLKGAKALVVGIANKSSIAYSIAKALRAFGADLAITYRAYEFATLRKSISLRMRRCIMSDKEVLHERS